MEEKWKDIEGYEGLYQVSNLGRIKSLERECHFKNRWGQDAVRHIDEMIMKQKVKFNGYLTICLSNGKTRKHILVHRLVAKAFIPNPENKPQIDHINGDKQLNIVTNLRWVTAEENISNPLWIEKANNVSKETRDKMSLSAHKSHNKAIVQYDLNGELVGIFDSAAIACRFYGYNKSSICDVLKGRHKQAYGYRWEYKKGDA